MRYATGSKYQFHLEKSGSTLESDIAKYRGIADLRLTECPHCESPLNPNEPAGVLRTHILRHAHEYGYRCYACHCKFMLGHSLISGGKSAKQVHLIDIPEIWTIPEGTGKKTLLAGQSRLGQAACGIVWDAHRIAQIATSYTREIRQLIHVGRRADAIRQYDAERRRSLYEMDWASLLNDCNEAINGTSSKLSDFSDVGQAYDAYATKPHFRMMQYIEIDDDPEIVKQHLQFLSSNEYGDGDVQPLLLYEKRPVELGDGTNSMAWNYKTPDQTERTIGIAMLSSLSISCYLTNFEKYDAALQDIGLLHTASAAIRDIHTRALNTSPPAKIVYSWTQSITSQGRRTRERDSADSYTALELLYREACAQMSGDSTTQQDELFQVIGRIDELPGLLTGPRTAHWLRQIDAATEVPAYEMHYLSRIGGYDESSSPHMDDYFENILPRLSTRVSTLRTTNNMATSDDVLLEMIWTKPPGPTRHTDCERRLHSTIINGLPEEYQMHGPYCTCTEQDYPYDEHLQANTQKRWNNISKETRERYGMVTQRRTRKAGRADPKHYTRHKDQDDEDNFDQQFTPFGKRRWGGRETAIRRTRARDRPETGTTEQQPPSRTASPQVDPALEHDQYEAIRSLI